MDPDLTLLAELVGDVDEFGEQHWGRRPMVRRSSFDVSGLLDIDEIERLLLVAARRPTFRLVKDGETLPAEESTSPVRLGGSTFADVADVGRIAEALHGGATVVLQSLQRTSMPIARFCRSLERATSHPVQANAYLTPAGGSGLASHRDDHDVLALQAVGSKSWVIDGLDEVTVRAGDVVYLPAGAEHSAAAQDETSLHVTVGFLGITHAHVAHRALDRMDELDLGRPLPLGYARPERLTALAEDLSRTFEEIIKVLPGIDVDALAHEEQRRAGTRRRPLLVGQLSAILDLDRVDAKSVVARRPDQPARIAAEFADDGRMVLELVDRRLRLPVAMRPAVERILASDELVVGSLPDLDEDSRIVLVKRLIREGLLITCRAGGA